MTGPPVQRQPAVSMHSPRHGCRAYFRGCIDRAGERQPFTRRTISRTRPACRCPRKAPTHPPLSPAPVARNTSWPPSHGPRPSSASVSRDPTNSLHQNLHNRLWLLLEILRRLGRTCSAFCVVCCSLAPPFPTPTPHVPPEVTPSLPVWPVLTPLTLLNSFAFYSGRPLEVSNSRWRGSWSVVSKRYLTNPVPPRLLPPASGLVTGMHACSSPHGVEQGRRYRADFGL